MSRHPANTNWRGTRPCAPYDHDYRPRPLLSPSAVFSPSLIMPRYTGQPIAERQTLCTQRQRCK